MFNVEELNKQRLGGSFEFLTMIAALLTIFVMAFGLITSALSRLRSMIGDSLRSGISSADHTFVFLDSVALAPGLCATSH